MSELAVTSFGFTLVATACACLVLGMVAGFWLSDRFSGRTDAKAALQTLKAMRPYVEGYIDRCDYTKGNQALAQLNAAIAKAEGR